MSIPKKIIGPFFQFGFLSVTKKEKCQSVRFTKKEKCLKKIEYTQHFLPEISVWKEQEKYNNK